MQCYFLLQKQGGETTQGFDHDRTGGETIWLWAVADSAGGCRHCTAVH